MLGIVASATQLLDDIPDTIVDDILDALPHGVAAIIAIIVVGIPLWLALAAAATVLSDYGFTLTSTGSELHVRRGLLDQREATVALHRVQAVRVQQTLLRAAIGRAAIEVQSAGAAGGQQGAVSRMTIPLLRVGELDRVLAELLPGATPLPPLIAAPPAARRRAILRRVVPWALVATAVVLVAWPWGSLALLVVPAAVIAGELAYRGLGHAATATHLVARNGALLRETVIVPVARAQSARLRTTPFQRRAGLATLAVDVAGKGSTPRAHDADAQRLLELHERVLATPAALADETAARRRARASNAAG
jgi:putative membrane protein